MKRKYNPKGQGLLLTGFPANVRQFYWVLAQEGCHPKATHRILGRIAKVGFDKLSVTSTLNFDWIEEQLKLINVKMDFIEPLENWYQKYYDGEWSKKDLPLKLQKI